MTPMAPGLRKLLRKLRAFPMLNRLVTSSARFVFRLLGRRPPDLLVTRLPRVGTVRVNVNGSPGISLITRGDEVVTNEIFWRGFRAADDPGVVAFHELAKRSRGIIDVGAYVGFHSVLAAVSNPQAS